MIKLVAKTKEVSNENINEESYIIAGKAAGVCYMADDYISNGINDLDKAIKRANNTKNIGHYSVFEHCTYSMLIETNKMMAMLLNSINVYNTSEKSARYTLMKPQSELELELYNKWTEKIYRIISNSFDEKQAKKLAIENARYFISVFTPTTLFYTINFGQLSLLVNRLEILIESCAIDNGNFANRIKEGAEKLKSELMQLINVEILKDNKNSYFRFLEGQRLVERINDEIVKLDDNSIKAIANGKKEYIGDSYTISYLGSIAMLAQSERHRSLRYSMFFTDKTFNGFYIPDIVSFNGLTMEWLDDMEKVRSIIPQATLVRITEQGIFEDFILKCKERLCSRAQLEIEKNTLESMRRFMNNRDNLSEYNKMILSKVFEKSRCEFYDFKCNDPCLNKKGALTRII